MFSYAHLLMHFGWTISYRFFSRFGLHCATHQIRVILISSVVITSLFYPALAIYSSSLPESLSIIDTFVTPGRVQAHKDLLNLWTGHGSMHIHDDGVSRAKCGNALRMERILIQSPVAADVGALNYRILLETLKLEQRLEQLISTGDTPCLQRPDGKCFVLSPLLFWDYDEHTLLSDINIFDTLSFSRNQSLVGIPITPQMVLAGRSYNQHPVVGTKFDSAMFLAITYFFPESDCVSNADHTSWLQMINKAAPEHASLKVQSQESALIALEHDPDLSKDKKWTALSACLYVAYLGFFAYVGWSVRRMDGIHSRIGVTFTALVEIAVSTITSLSVCALVGFKVTMVPWEMLPIVIVFVGAENMFNLVDAVRTTSVTLPVKQRISDGLSRGGSWNTLKVVLYNSVLGIIAVFSVGAVRQFCVFAIVVLVAHWFLAHTFFIAVLSIDIQRLELDELLRHDPSLNPTVPPIQKDSVMKQPQSRWQKIIARSKSLLKGHASTDISIVILLAITGALYYTTRTASTSMHDITRTSISAVPQGPLLETAPAWAIWKLLNSNKLPLLHIRMEMPTTITFWSDQMKDHEIDSPRFSMRTLYLIVWLLKIMVLPIAATTGGLWGLLLYLLKDAELLEAQRNRTGTESINLQEGKLDKQVKFSTLPRAFASDVELIAASKNGQMIVSVGLHNEITLWRRNDKHHISIDAMDVLLQIPGSSCASSTLTSVAVDDGGNYCAVGTGAGVIAIWAISNGEVRSLPPVQLDNSCAAVTGLHFIHDVCRVPMQAPPQADPQPLAPKSGVIPKICATYDSGVAAQWTFGTVLDVTYFTPSHQASVVRSFLLPIAQEERLLAAFCFDDGALEVMELCPSGLLLQPGYCVEAGSPFDTVSKVHACRVELKGSTRLIIAAASMTGLVSLWDGSSGECISTFEDAYGVINNLRVCPIDCRTCRFCGQLPMESLSIAFSVDHVIRFFKLYLDDQNRRCSCSQTQPRHGLSRDGASFRSRSNSGTACSVTSMSPSATRMRLNSTSESQAFPVSAHGVHSRRSEKDSGRRSFELPAAATQEQELNKSGGSETSKGTTDTPSLWKKALVVLVADTTCERGAWDVSSKNIIGMRRKPRTRARTKEGSVDFPSLSLSQGLTAATLERWEFWTFDPSSTRLHSSLLVDLEPEYKLIIPPTTSSPSRDLIPRLPFTRVSPLLTASSYALAGFGNTVGIFTFSDS